jgi:TPR repeat protein
MGNGKVTELKTMESAELKTVSSTYWSRTQALALALFSLLLGVCGGWLIRKSFSGQVPHPTAVAVAGPHTAGGSVPSFSSTPTVPTGEEVKQAADSEATAPLEQLKDDPTNAALLAQIGNIYYDAKQYTIAIDYYERSLKSEPNDTSVRTDLGTAYWYTGDADKAIKEFRQALADDPNKANALFNLGVVEWKGKHDAATAIADWQTLLATHPRFRVRAKVEELIAEAQGSTPQKP